MLDSWWDIYARRAAAARRMQAMREKTMTREQFIEEARRIAATRGYMIRPDETISAGQQYIGGHGLLSLTTCESIDPFDNKVHATDPFMRPLSPNKCVLVVPLPRPDERSIVEQLQLLVMASQDTAALLREQNKLLQEINNNLHHLTQRPQA